MACVVAGSAGCYRQAPLEIQPPPPNTRVAATLTDSGVVAMSNALGAGPLKVEGLISSATDSDWTLQMLRVEHRDGRAVTWNREAVRIPRTLLTDPRVVTLDKKRSWLAGGGIVVGAFVLARVFNLVGADKEDDETPVPAESVLWGGGR